MDLPFKMIIETPTERYRAESFWTKEPETLAWIDSFADGDVFFDVGANVGLYSLYCAAVHPGCRIYAFEPDAKNYARLQENRIESRFPPIIAFPLAVCDVTATLVFYEASMEVGSSGGQLDLQPDGSPARYAVRASLLDDLTAWLCIPQHIKIDIDGQEARVVRGMKQTLENQALRSVLIEIDLGDPRSRDEILSAFIGAGFTTVNRFNMMTPHSRERRAKEGINVENVIFTRS